MKRDKRTCAIIGSGIGGLAAAIRLAHSGFDVTVFEANATPGGKMAELHADGFRFDMGPTVLTKPEYIDELFSLWKKNPRDYFEYVPVDPIFRYFFSDGTVIRSHRNNRQFANEVANKTEDTADSVLDFLKKAATKHELTDKVFLQRSLHRIRNYFNRETLRGVLNFGKIEAFKTMNEANQRQFNDQRVVDIFNRYAGYNGSNPYLAPATLNVIAHYEITLGTYFAQGGIYAIVKALMKLAEEVGVQFRFNTSVKAIQVENGRATGIETENGAEQFDVTVSNADVYNTYHKLIPNEPRPKRSLEQPRSSSVIVFYWGIRQTFPQLGLHNMFLSADSEEEYDHIFNKRTVCSDPTVHLTISCKKHPADAPDGCENWAALISTPHNTGQDWDAIVADARKAVIRKASNILGADLEPLITYESVLDPRKVEQQTASAFGSVFGNSSNSKFAAFLRHPNFSSKIKNLYFCGGTVHPGAGVPLCLLSAKIATDLIHEDLSSAEDE